MDRTETERSRPIDDEGRPIGFSRFQLVVVALMFLGGALVYPYMPERFPVHWNAFGQIDRWATKSLFEVFLMPLITLGMVVLFWVLPRIDPFRRSYERFKASYYLLIDVTIGFMAFMFAITTYAAFSTAAPIGTIVPLGIGILFAAIGNQLTKVKRNFFVGIRTPWTLASEAVWVKTHRLGGRLFVGAGLLAAVCAFLPPPFNFAVFMVLILGTTAVTTVYSYVVFRQLEKAGRLGSPMEPPPPAA